MSYDGYIFVNIIYCRLKILRGSTFNAMVLNLNSALRPLGEVCTLSCMDVTPEGFSSVDVG